MSEEEKEKYDEIIKIINETSLPLIVEDFVEDMYKKIESQQKELELLKDQKEYVINEYSETIDKKDKQIEQYQNMLATNDMLHVIECEKKDKIIEKLLTEITAVNSGRYEYMDNEEVLKIFEKKVEGEE